MSRASARLAVLAWITMVASPAVALEKTSRRAIVREDWSASTTITVRYYNYCTGWVWVWSTWQPGETVAVNFDALPVSSWFLNEGWTLTFSGVPSGYGFTGTIEALGGQDCAAPVLASQPWLPPVTTGWSSTAWGGLPVPRYFSLAIVWNAASGFTNGTGLASDHPAAGPTGPQACGVCFPTSRTVHTRYYGVGGTYCPSGTTLFDGVCEIELMVEVGIKGTVVGLEGDSWGKVKSLYR